MPAKKRPEAQVSEHDIEGHAVRLIQRPDQEELWIDGTRRKFFKTEEGYVLFDRAYVPSRTTLLEAVRDYLADVESRKPGKPAKSGKKSGDR